MKFHRRSIRLREYDYSQPGAYFVTIAAFQRECLFGEIVNGEMRLNAFGKIAEECWHTIPEHFLDVELGAYVIMPNHVHGIIIIHEGKSFQPVGAQHAAPLQKPHIKPGSLGAVIRSFKSAVTREIRRKSNVTDIWQRNYVSHVLCGITNT